MLYQILKFVIDVSLLNSSFVDSKTYFKLSSSGLNFVVCKYYNETVLVPPLVDQYYVTFILKVDTTLFKIIIILCMKISFEIVFVSCWMSFARFSQLILSVNQSNLKLSYEQ